MGKNQKIKEQRKIEKIQKSIDKQKNRKKLAIYAICSVLVCLFGVGLFKGTIFVKNKFFAKKKENKVEQTANKTGDHKYSKAPDMTIDTNKTYTAKFETNKGSFDIKLNAKEAPKTVNNFVFLARDKFYDGLSFHRIVKDFMIQGGDPQGTGAGDPGYKFDDEKNNLDYTPGTLAMANSGANTNGSQFFIMTGDYSGGKLPKNYTIFGAVESGMDIVSAIGAAPTSDNGQGEQSKPNEKIVINKVTIEEK